jgi:NAD(P)-dependent dehydrogenase (short-subunit alcohol dehydrogenase family)
MASAAEFKGKAALITGGSDGIGLRVAEQLAEAGAHVSGAAAQVTGQTISVNGGLSFGGW